MNKTIITLMLTLSMSSLVQADDRSRYAYEFDIQPNPGQSMTAIDFEERVYTRMHRDDFRDFAVFNADGESLPSGLLAAKSKVFKAYDPAAFMSLPDESRLNTATQRIFVELADKAEQGTRISIVNQDAALADQGMRIWLIDLGPQPREPFDGLRLITPDSEQFQLRVNVSGSDDLQSWQRIASHQSIIRLRQDQLLIERTELNFGWQSQRYLRVETVGESEYLPEVKSLEVRRTRGLNGDRQVHTIEVPGKGLDEEPGVFEFVVPGPIPAHSVEFLLPASNTVYSVDISSRSRAQPKDKKGNYYWHNYSRKSVYQLGVDGTDYSSEPIPIETDRHTIYRVTTIPQQDQAPSLRFSYRPDRIAFVARGAEPYTLAVGALQASSSDSSMQTALTAMRALNGADWAPPLVGIGDARVGNPSALQPEPEPFNWRSFLLWAILLVGAGVVSLTAVKMLRKD